MTEAFNILKISTPLCLKKFLSSAETKASFTLLGIFSTGTKILFCRENSANKEPSPV